MLKSKSKNVEFPCGNFFIDPDTDYRIEGNNRANLLGKIRHYRKINNLDPIENLEAVVEHFLCLHSPKGFCTGTLEEGDVRLGLSAKDIYKTSELMIKLWRQSGFKEVSREHAIERSKVCVACEKQASTRQMCTGCSGLYSIVKSFFSSEVLPDDKNLLTCVVCKCLNQAQVRVPIRFFRDTVKPDELSQYPETCWKRKELEQYYGQ